MNPIIFITLMLCISVIFCYSVIRYTNSAFQLSTNNIKPNLVLNNYDDQFVDIAYKIGKLRTAQDFDNATKCIQIFQDTYKPHPDHQQWVVENDVNVLLSLLNARLESLQNDGLPIYV